MIVNGRWSFRRVVGHSSKTEWASATVLSHQVAEWNTCRHLSSAVLGYFRGPQAFPGLETPTRPRAKEENAF